MNNKEKQLFSAETARMLLPESQVEHHALPELWLRVSLSYRYRGMNTCNMNRKGNDANNIHLPYASSLESHHAQPMNTYVIFLFVCLFFIILVMFFYISVGGNIVNVWYI